MRTYTTNEGKLPDLQARFRDHTLGFFKSTNMTSIGYWVPTDGPTSQTTLVYILVAPEPGSGEGQLGQVQPGSRMAKVAAASQVDGKILAKSPESVFLNATDYSPIK